MLDINLKGAWLVGRRVIPLMIAAVGSDHQQFVGRRFSWHESTHALRGVEMGTDRADEVVGDRAAPYGIRVVSIHPTGVNTPMNDGLARVEGSRRRRSPRSAGNLLPVPWIEPEDVADAVVFLASGRSVS